MNRAIFFVTVFFCALSKVAGQTEHTIPVVVHVLHNYGPENVSDDRIMDAIRNWDSVFNAENADTADVIQPFKKYIGNAHIHFRLATIDPDGNVAKGITRHFSYLTNNAGDQSKLDQWPPDKYLNIWLVKALGQPNTDVAGYADPPAVAAYRPYYDGVMQLSSYVNTGKQVERNIGHFLSLQNIWGNYYTAGVFCDDDGVDDTPPTKGHLSYGCLTSSLYDTSCAVGYMVHYLDALGLDSLVDYPDTANAQNIMDNTFCSRMFTKGQCEHMRAALASNVAGRSNLVSPANLTATGVMQPVQDLPPVAEFSVEQGKVTTGIGPNERTYFACADNPALRFRFRNWSWRDTITDVQLHFSNGAITADTTFAPPGANAIDNQFTQPGWVTVSVTATGNNTGTTTYTDQHAVYAADGNNPIVEDPQVGMHFMDFNAGQTDKWPIFNYYNNNFKWQLNSTVGYYDHTCIEYHGFDTRQFPANETGSPVGDYDDFFSEAYDLTAMQAGYCNLNFMSAGASRVNNPALMTDTFDVGYSIDCGRSWISLKKYSGTDLANNGSLSVYYEPLWLGEWRLNSIELPAAARANKVFFRFRYKPGGDPYGLSTGNNYYMDRISMSNFPTGTAILLKDENDFTIAPNPTAGSSVLMVNSVGGGTCVIAVTDATGRVVYSGKNVLEKGSNRYIIPSGQFTAGLYFVTITGPKLAATRKLVVCK